MRLELAKYHGLGNDFLVLVDEERSLPVDASLAAALCDRHRGVGADGLVRLSVPGAEGPARTEGAATGERPTGERPTGERQSELRFELWNADGSVAETSGNGLRCAALAAVHAGLVTGSEFDIDTLAGPVAVRVTGSAAAEVRVAMGRLTVGPELSAAELPVTQLPVTGLPAAAPSIDSARGLDGRWARQVDVGNPHVVIYGKDADAAAVPAIDLAEVGAEIEARTPGGVNVEVVAVPSDDRVVLEVWERGAGLTLACGTGSCAAAAACRAAGLVGDVVAVENPGGTLTVELGGDLLHPVAMLTGPARRIATVQVETDELDGLAAPSRPAGSATPEAALAAPGRP